MTRQAWTPEALATLRQHYPDKPTRDVAAMLGCSHSRVYNKAFDLGLQKTKAYWDGEKHTRIQRCRTDPRMTSTQFAPGLVPWNKGRKGWQAGGRSVYTQFTTGMEPHNTHPLGSLRVICSRKGIRQLERKIGTASGPSHLRWRSVHRLVWEAVNGPVPKGHLVVFKPGMKTLIEAEITIEKVECISRAENAARNHPNRRDPELAKLIQLKGAITRQVNRINRESHAA